MASILRVTDRNDTVSFRADIRLKRDGRVVHLDIQPLMFNSAWNADFKPGAVP